MKHDKSGVRPVDEAAARLQAELHAVTGRTAPLTTAAAEQAWRAYIRFARQCFATPATPDADSLLFEYGTFALDGPPAFTLDLSRQFEVEDEDGEHDHYVQVHCALRYAPAPGLRTLGHFGSWFVFGSDGDVDRWAHEVRSQAVWKTVRDHEPTTIAISQERV
ncbi:hypothetical protein [Streptomyces paromomycinus]|uniref:Uncharacterized protein n=1 Tax=Streptomyces paromomycinus TaxID=92743 RepID=A0A401WEV8_STREY|nr:hypothetical protein [Streptomyces paromomycinus]GCD47842.1 hypothetical protein GKJPGBOP_07636 [Streptomyces paromomycinus]